MNNCANVVLGWRPGGGYRGTTTSTMSISSQYVPLLSEYEPQHSAPVVDISPPLSVGPSPPPPPPPSIDTNAMFMRELPSTIQAARSVRPSVVFVASKGVRKDNLQGSRFVVAFDDSNEDVGNKLENRACILLLQ